MDSPNPHPTDGGSQIPVASGLEHTANFSSAAAMPGMTESGHNPGSAGQIPGTPSSYWSPGTPSVASPKPRNKIVTVIKYVLAVAAFLFGLAGLFVAFDPTSIATKSSFQGTTLTSLVFLIPAAWFFACEIIDKIRVPKMGRRIKRFLWLPALASVSAFIAVNVSSGDSYGHHLSTTGDFKEILAVHDEAKQECFNSVLNYAKFTASADIADFQSGISVATSGELAIHSFAGTAHFPNTFGVLSEYVFLCERAQDARDSSGYAADADLSYHNIDVEEKDFLTPVPTTNPSGIWENVDTEDILGFEHAELQPDSVYIFFDESDQASS